MEAKLKKDWFGRQKSVEELHNDSRKWITEIDFIHDEMRFLEHLLSSTYIDFLEQGYQYKINKIVTKITEEKGAGKTLKNLLFKHGKVLSDLIKSESVLSNKNYLETHKKFEREINIFLRKYKALKKEVFDIVENIIQIKNQKKIAPKSYNIIEKNEKVNQ